MKKEIEINELIESYLKGTLSDIERISFEKRMQKDASLSQQVNLYRQLHGMISDSVYLNVKNDLKHIHLKKVSTSKMIRRITGFGSGGLLIGIVIFLAIKNGANNQALLQEIPYPATEQTITDTASSERKALSQDIDTGDTETSLLPAKNIVPHAKASDEETVQPARVPQANHEEMKTAGTDALKSDKTDTTQNHVPISDIEASVNVPGHDDDSIFEETGTVDCSNISIKAVFTTHPSCNNKPTGNIEIDRQSIQGGEPPYGFSLNQKTFTDTVVFTSLYPGRYPVYVKDDNDCTSQVGDAIIESEDCTYQAVFAPLNGETWTVPVERDKEGMLLIYSKAGTVVYSISVNGNETTVWNGQTVNGQILPMGLYQFEIRYNDGSTFTGNVTILR